MAMWLFKEEPNSYSFADLQRDGETVWEGVSNALALKYLRQVKKGDRILFYHTGKEKAVVGEMKAVADAEVSAEEPKNVRVKVKPVHRWKTPVHLARIKKEPDLAEWELVRLPRLSIMPLTEVQWGRVEALSQPAE